MDRLQEQEIAVLLEALDDEYKAWATYDQVLAGFGETPPSSHMRDAEGRHIEALCTLFARYGLPVPANPWRGKAPRYPDLQAACAAAVDGEIANDEMCGRLLASTQRQDILGVLRHLQEASQQRHLPALQRCVQAGGECASGGGRRRRRGAGGPA